VPVGDRDGDGLPDDYELQFGLDPDFKGDTIVDLDGDGLDQLAEFRAGTDPTNSDTDGDTRSDALEVNTGTDPLVADPLPPGKLLGDNCVISVLNRSTRVTAGGGWILPNVPANFAPVRARALCNDNGLTREGHSDFFALDRDGIVEVSTFSFDGSAPIPTKVAISAPTGELTTPFEVLTLQATATLPDGTSQDVTSAPGMSWQTSNLNIASIDSFGNVTAQSSGTALISAWLDGALGVFEVKVRLSGDSDGDGLSDDFEIANGLDPNNPADAFDDVDGDGLSISDEFARGLDPFDPDSDDDGLLDGFEVTESRTNPLLRDSDGDLVSDGLELKAGSDPSDGLDVNIGPILAELRVSPERFSLVFNLVQGEVSRQVEIKGTLEDGTELDLTNPLYDTRVTSDTPAVAFPGIRPGSILAGAAGTAIVTATNGPKAAAVIVDISRFAPQLRGHVTIPGAPNAVDLLGDYALVAAGAGDLQIVSIADPDHPGLVASLALPGYSFGVAATGTRAWVAAGSAGLVGVDLSSQLAPQQLGSAPTPTPALDVAVADGLALVVDGSGLRVFDVTNALAPSLIGSLDLPGKPRDVAFDSARALAVIAAEDAGLLVVSLENPSLPVLIGQAATRLDGSSSAAGVTLRDQIAYVADGALNLGGLRVVDLRNPALPFVVGSSSDRLGLVEVAFDSGVVAAADYYFLNSTLVFDVRSTPVLAAQIENNQGGDGTGIAAREGFSYLVTYSGSQQSFPIWGQGNLFISELVRLATDDDEPASPPWVDWVRPTEDVVIKERRRLELEGMASDDAGIRSVELYLGESRAASDSVPPYTFNLEAPRTSGTYPLKLVATDLAGNLSESRILELEVESDDDPVATLLTPTESSNLLEARPFEVLAEASDDFAVTRVEFAINGEVRATLTREPYQAELLAPGGAPTAAIRVTAFDELGQSASEERIVPVAPDQTPYPVLLAPTPTTPAVVGGLLQVRAGVVDDYGIPVVHLLINGEEVAEDRTPPYDFTYRVPATATLDVRVRAVDIIGQELTTPGLILPVVADPGTTAVGRVVLSGDVGLAGVPVICAGVSGISGVDGEFAVAGIPSGSLEIRCTAQALVEGVELSGSAGAIPVAAGLSEIGEILLASGNVELLYLTAPTAVEGTRIRLVDSAGGRPLPFGEELDVIGAPGLAFDTEDHLYVHTNGYEGSFIYQVNPDSLQQEGGQTAIFDADGYSHSFVDITFDPVRHGLLGLELYGPFQGMIHVIDLEAGSSTVLTPDLNGESGGLTFGDDGLLYVLLLEPGFIGGGIVSSGDFEAIMAAEGETTDRLKLLQVDPRNGAVLETRVVQTFEYPSQVGSLTLLGNGHLLASINLSLVEINPSSGETSCYLGCSTVVGAEALAIRRFRRQPLQTSVVGRVVDVGGNSLAGMEIRLLGGYTTTTDASGTFALSGIDYLLPWLQIAAADPFGLEGASSLVPVVAGGMTDLGDTVWQHTACSEGNIILTGDCPNLLPSAAIEVAYGPGSTLASWRSFSTEPDGSFCSLTPSIYESQLQTTANCGCPSGEPAICRGSLYHYDSDAFGRSCGSSWCDSLPDLELYCECP